MSRYAQTTLADVAEWFEPGTGAEAQPEFLRLFAEHVRAIARSPLGPGERAEAFALPARVARALPAPRLPSSCGASPVAACARAAGEWPAPGSRPRRGAVRAAAEERGVAEDVDVVVVASLPRAAEVHGPRSVFTIAGSVALR